MIKNNIKYKSNINLQNLVSFFYINWLKKITPKFLGFINFNQFNVELITNPNNLKPLLNFLSKNSHSKFNIISDICCYDMPGSIYRFILVYNLLSINFNNRISVITQQNEVNSVPSVVDIFKGALWLEREVWDMFGVFFYKHPDLRRILTDYGFQGHPLRKDFPLMGFFELNYSDSDKTLNYYTLELAQEFRNN